MIMDRNFDIAIAPFFRRQHDRTATMDRGCQAARRFLAQFVEAVHRQMACRIHLQVAVKHRICKRFLNGHFDRRRDGIVNDAAVAKGGDEF